MHSEKSLKLQGDKAKAELCRRSFFYFFKEFWETIEAVDLKVNWHIEYLCDELQDVYSLWQDGVSQLDILINIPPGSSKSTIVTQLFPVWLWVRNPAIRIISASYAADLSTAHAVKSRDCLKSDKFERYFPNHIELKEDTDGKTHYKNKAKGERFTTSTGGRVTGMHGDFIIIDDPINPENSSSEVERKVANRYIKQTLSTRKTDKNRSVTIMVMQRLHDDDPSGMWLKEKKEGLRHICLPGRLANKVRPESLMACYVDGLLDPVRLNHFALRKLESDLGSYGFAGQIQQDTTPESGGIWQRWFTEIPDHLFPTVKEMTDYGTDWDTAYTESESNASSAFVCSGLKGGKMYIDSIGWMNKEFPDLIAEMKSLPSPHYIEAKASGKSAKQTLVRAGIAAIEVQVKSDKIARARDATPKAEAGMVCIRKSIAEKLYDASDQGILKFPNGKMDLADTLAQAILRHFAKTKATMGRFKGSR